MTAVYPGTGSPTLDAPLTVAQGGTGSSTPAGAAAAIAPIQLGTVQAATSGTFKNWSIPVGAKRANVNFSDFSTSGSSTYLVQIGPVAGPETSEYIGRSAGWGGTGSAYTTGFPVHDSPVAGFALSGSMRLELQDPSTNTWVAGGNFVNNGSLLAGSVMAGKKSIAGALGVIRVTTVNGTDTLDGGSVNVSWEF